MVDGPFNQVYVWKKDFVVVFEHNFSFFVDLPNFIFTFTHHVKPIIEKVNSDDEIHVVVEDITIEVYDGPPPSWEYVCLLEEASLKTQETLIDALHEKAYAKREARNWKLYGDYFFKKYNKTLVDLLWWRL